MNSIFSFQLPAKSDLSDETIQEIVQAWMDHSPYYSFGSLSLTTDRGNPHFCSENAELDFSSTTDEDGKHYIGTRLSKADALNVEWVADFIYERGPDKSFFYVHLSRGMINPDAPTNMHSMPNMPDVTKLISNLLLDDAGFKMTAHPIHLTPSVFQKFQSVLTKQIRPVLPILFINCSNVPEMKDIAEAIAAYFSGMVHVIVATNGEIAQCGQMELSTLYFKGATIYFPRVDVAMKIPFTADYPQEFEDIVKCMTAYISQQTLPVNTMSLDKLKLLQEDKRLAPYPANPISGEYCLMNNHMAEFLKAARKRAGFSQAELASKAGTTGLIISRLETLRITRVKRLLLQRIEQSLNLKPGTIVALETERSSGTSDATTQGKSASQAQCSDEPIRHTKSLFCRKCGTKLFDDSVFCHVCGLRLPEDCS